MMATDMEATDGDRGRETAGGTAAQRPTAGVSTADMAAAMERRSAGDGGSSTPAEAGTSAGAGPDGTTPLFPSDESEAFRSRWVDIQTGFVDEPRQAVEQADGLVADVIQRLAQVFADERGKL